jgi:hypothetical protein
MTICSEYGITHSEFLSWSPDDRSKAVAFFIEKNAKCGMCGTAEWEWEEDKHAYEPVEKFCMGCYLKEISGEEAGRQMPGTTVSLMPTGTREHAQYLVNMERRWKLNGVE